MGVFSVEVERRNKNFT